MSPKAHLSISWRVTKVWSRPRLRYLKLNKSLALTKGTTLEEKHVKAGFEPLGVVGA
jgi:hypothetical protein